MRRHAHVDAWLTAIIRPASTKEHARRETGPQSHGTLRVSRVAERSRFMFWNGTRWIDERARAASPPPTRRRGRDWLATGVLIVGIVALAIPFLATSAAASSATQFMASWGGSHETRVFQESTVPPDPTGTLTPTATPVAIPTPVPTPVPTAVATGVSRALGMYVHNSAWNFPLLDAYAAQVGRMPSFATTYQMWGTSGDGWQFDTTMLNAFAARGIVNILTWQPFDWNAGGAQPAFALSTILSGAHDATIQTWVAAAKAYGKPVYIRFAHEMNGDFYPWGQGVNGNTPTQFVAVWKYVVGLFRAGGATNVRWVWSPNVIGASGQYPLAGLYPGDAYVDLIGLDGYNWGTGGLGEVGWRSFTQIFGATYDQVRALAPSKPIYIAEMASAESGGDKAAWISSAFLTEIPRRFPALVGVVWFDAFGAMQLVTPAQNADWAVDSSPSALAAFRNVVASPEWRGALR